MIGIFLFGLILLFVIGFPAIYAIGIISLVILSILNHGFFNIPFGMLAQKMVWGVNNFTLLAIPFFLLAGKLMNIGSITKKIFTFCNALVGWIPGGLAHANILASIVFAGMSGSAVADAAGLGTIEIRAMEDEGYDTDFAAAVTAASSTIGPIIPPSIPLIMFGVAGNVSITKLLIAGIIPGLIMGVAIGLLVVLFAIKRNYPRKHFPRISEIFSLFKQAFFPLLTPIILIGGILGGIFTPTEAAAVASLYAFILTFFVYKEMSLGDFFKVCLEVIRETSQILCIVAISTLYGYLLVKTNIPNKLMDLIISVSNNQAIFLIYINIFLLIVGCFMDANAAIIILTPIILPIAIKMGVSPVHLGIVVVLNLMIGLLTPPVGMCLYATSRVAKISFDSLLKAVVPFYIPLFLTLLLITYVPQIVLFLPNLIH